MKQLLLIFSFLVTVQVTNAQIIRDSTTILIEGTFAKDGKIVLKPGYEFKVSTDNRVATVVAISNNKVKGTYICSCPLENGTCTTSNYGKSLDCGGSTCCEFIVTSSVKMLSTFTRDKINNSPDVKWKVLKLPAKTN